MLKELCTNDMGRHEERKKEGKRRREREKERKKTEKLEGKKLV